eukprot:TRINITY_DN14073_c0_g1_i1.p1 TRINITY_DN14073_c0_g1~~TRINITY_DN14073_c0_g1_i1.p1  ORF type:complete len:192 (+),score=60.23 TRINITY_DN14073_c0_g1_i1:76-651(+)
MRVAWVAACAALVACGASLSHRDVGTFEEWAELVGKDHASCSAEDLEQRKANYLQNTLALLDATDNGHDLEKAGLNDVMAFVKVRNSFDDPVDAFALLLADLRARKAGAAEDGGADNIVDEAEAAHDAATSAPAVEDPAALPSPTPRQVAAYVLGVLSCLWCAHACPLAFTAVHLLCCATVVMGSWIHPFM